MLTECKAGEKWGLGYHESQAWLDWWQFKALGEAGFAIKSVSRGVNPSIFLACDRESGPDKSSVDLADNSMLDLTGRIWGVAFRSFTG